MALVSQRPLCCLLGTRVSLLNQIQVRFSIREEIHKYREPDKFKKHMLHATQPYFKRVYRLPSESCKGISNNRHPLHPLEQIYRQELVEAVKSSEFFLIFQYNWTPFQSERVYKNTLIKAGCQLQIYNNNVYKAAFLEDLGLKELDNIFVTKNGVVTGATKDLPTIVDAFKNMNEFMLLVGHIGGQLYEADQLNKIASMKDILTSRQELLSTLTSPSIILADQLHIHSQSTESPAEGMGDAPVPSPSSGQEVPPSQQ